MTAAVPGPAGGANPTNATSPDSTPGSGQKAQNQGDQQQKQDGQEKQGDQQQKQGDQQQKQDNQQKQDKVQASGKDFTNAAPEKTKISDAPICACALQGVTSGDCLAALDARCAVDGGAAGAERQACESVSKATISTEAAATLASFLANQCFVGQGMDVSPCVCFQVRGSGAPSARAGQAAALGAGGPRKGGAALNALAWRRPCGPRRHTASCGSRHPFKPSPTPPP